MSLKQTSTHEVFEQRTLPPYSVLMSTYEKDHADWLIQAIESMAQQSWPPAEIVLVEDGPLPNELSSAIETCETKYPGLIRRLIQPKRMGLAYALAYGILECQFDWIARMDADDISALNRCELELRLAQSMDVDIVGCDCAEFIDDIDHVVSRRLFPEDHEALFSFSKRRTPFCHPSVIMKKQAVLRAGNYHDVYLLEDYDLFVRMFQSGSKGCTLKTIAYYVRVGQGFYNRRGGIRYVAELVKFNAKLLRQGYVSILDFFTRSMGNIIVGLSPSALRSWIYRRLLRK